MSDSADLSASDPAIVFRPSKKRSTLRHRSHPLNGPNADTDTEPPLSTSDPLHGDALAAEEESVSVSGVLRSLSARKARLHGVEFRTKDALAATPKPNAPTEADEAVEAAVQLAIPQRFTRQTGRIGELNDKHM